MIEADRTGSGRGAVVRKDVIWAADQWPSLEYVIAQANAGGVRADSQLVMAEQGPARVSYQLECDTGWRFRALQMSLTSPDGERALTMTAEPGGRWIVNGEHRADLATCTDIDASRSRTRCPSAGWTGPTSTSPT
jgi:hypothetical protein